MAVKTTVQLCVVSVLSVLTGGCIDLQDQLEQAQRLETQKNVPVPVATAGGKDATTNPAIFLCRNVQKQARSNALAKEIIGYLVGSAALTAGGALAAEAANKGNSQAALDIYGAGVAGAVALGAISVYLLTSASYDRTGDAILAAAGIQMQHVDVYADLLPIPSDGHGAGGGSTGAAKGADLYHVQWQTCSKALGAWAAAGAGGADSAVASAFGGKSSGGNGKGSGNGQGTASEMALTVDAAKSLQAISRTAREDADNHPEDAESLKRVERAAREKLQRTLEAIQPPPPQPDGPPAP